jgi:hypothetical protein
MKGKGGEIRKELTLLIPEFLLSILCGREWSLNGFKFFLQKEFTSEVDTTENE